MGAPVSGNIKRTFAPPVMEAYRWLDGVEFPTDRPLINVSQAAPAAPPPQELRQAIADIALNDDSAHLYGPDLGLPTLRAQIATDWSRIYGGTVTPDQVAITSGCNQAFTAAMTTLAEAGDEVILPTPWYFNHKMHLDMQGITAVPLPTGDTLLPDPAQAERLITPRTRAIVLVTPNNPGGVEYPATLVRAFYELAKRHDLALLLDETYRDFDSRSAPVHDLFTAPDWPDTLIQLYSFSKAFRLTGHRIGSMVASVERLAQVEKYIDTVTICPNQIGQRAALWGMRNLGDWLAGERAEILERRAAIRQGFDRLPNWQLLGLGGFFAYVRHPFDLPSDEVARLMVAKAGILLLPATFFKPTDDPTAKQELRIAFANIDTRQIKTLFDRLENLTL